MISTIINFLTNWKYYIIFFVVIIVLHFLYKYWTKEKQVDVEVERKTWTDNRYKHDPSKEWSRDNVMLSIGLMSKYVHTHGEHIINNLEDSEEKKEMQEEWTEHGKDSLGFFPYHDETSGNLQSFLSNVVLPNMKKRSEILAKIDTPDAIYLNNLADEIIWNLENEYPTIHG